MLLALRDEPVNARQQFGKDGEARFCAECACAGREVKPATEYNSPFDVDVDGWKIDVKTSKPNKPTFNKQRWQFRLHVHGKKSPLIDFYVLRVENLPDCRYRKAISLLVRAAEVRDKQVIYVTLESLLHDATVRSWADAYRSFLAGRFASKQVAA